MIATEPALFPASEGGGTPMGPGPIEQKVRETLDGLAADGLMIGKYIAVSATLLSTARAVDRGMEGGPRGVSVATAQLMKMLLESLESLPEPLTGQEPYFDALDAQLQALTKEALA